MTVQYENGMEIEKINREELNLFYVRISENNYSLSAKLLIDQRGWAEIFIRWIMAAFEQMWFRDHGSDKVPEEERIRAAKLFLEGADAAECDKFLEKYIAMLVDPLLVNICNEITARGICSEIDKKLAQAEPYLRLRVKAVCLLTNRFPQNLFLEGAGWAGLFTVSQDEAKLRASELWVKENDIFELDPCAGLGKPLVPKTLRNKSEKVCRIEVRCGGIKYLIKLPPYGALRAVFAEGGTMVSLKGCISCCNTQNAVFQRGGREEIRLFSSSRGGMVIELRPPSPLWDGCADIHDGIPGAVILTANELYSTLTGLRLERSGEAPLPVRCYCAGNQWAWLYADGRLDSNLAGADGGQMHGVTAVAEDAERGLLICREGRFYDYRATFEKEISQKEFIGAMLNRFTQAGKNECEIQQTGFARWAILDSGEVKQ